MSDHLRAVWSPLMAMSFIALLAACTNKPLPLQLEKYCVSESGMSKYWITIRTSEREGDIRYKYMGQDVRYKITAMKIDGAQVSGQADFQSSSTGEEHGTPILFSYDSATDILNDGVISAACQYMQDSEQG